MFTAIFDFIVPFVVVLGVLVFIHELGHYAAAKLFGMKVDAFSLGFPPRAWGFRWATRRLQDKFKRDLGISLLTYPGFQTVHRAVGNHSRHPDDTARLLNDLFVVTREEVVEDTLDKKGRPQKSTRVLLRLATNEGSPTVLPGELVERVRSLVAADEDLLEWLLHYREIHDSKEFRRRWATDYCLSWVPLGGYCKINGMVDESFDPESMKEGRPRPWEFRAKPVWQRIVVISGGVLFNFLLAGLIFAAVAFVKGLPEFGTQISSVVPGSPAEKAGLVAGDRILSVDQQAVQRWEELVMIIQRHPALPVLVRWQRGQDVLSAEIVPESKSVQTSEGPREIGQIGIGAPAVPEFTRGVGPGEAVQLGFTNVVYMTGFILKSLRQIVFGQQSLRDALGGPVAIFRMTGEVKQQRGWEGIWSFMALLSISLAVFNLFPIPALDGGHLVFLIIEGIIRRPLSVKVKLYAQQIGMAILLTFIAFVIYNDLAKWHGM